MGVDIPAKIKPVIKRAESVGIPLTNYIDSIIKTYINGGVKGITFRPKNYVGLRQSVIQAIRKMVLFDDNYADTIGGIMGSDARRHGYAISAREKNLTNSLHVELNSKKCDFHLDSRSITTGEPGFPMWGGHYNPVRFIPHGIRDLAPSMLADSKLSALSPIVSPILSRLDLQLGLNGRQLVLDGNIPQGSAQGPRFMDGLGRTPQKEKLRIGFTLTFEY